ncbi:hypothetical protein JT359_13720 [Candidatus Poribacteria bacterium]|nr:hypothetical protein [Candidatus Poribacteria bacterium]
MGTDKDLSPLDQAKVLLEDFNLEGAILFDHLPVLRLQVSESQFSQVMELRSELVDKLKPTGFRFISIDLNTPT